MIFDGSPVLVGDSVFDLAYGPGIVVELKPVEQRFIVRFGQRYVGYTLSGVGNFDRKTLYWRDPVLSLPVPKSSDKWSLFTQIKQSIHNAILGSN
jgi:hypothetical protein